MAVDDTITMSDPLGIALVVGVAATYLAIRLIPRLIVGRRAFLPAERLMAMMGAGEPCMLLDVRSPGEYNGDTGHLPSAENVPLEVLKTRLEDPAFVANCRQSSVIAVCRTDGRSAFAVRLLRRFGVDRAFLLAGGMDAWLDAGGPVESSEKARIA